MRIPASAAIFFTITTSTLAQDPGATASSAVYGPRLEGFSYAHPVKVHRFTSQRQPIEMAYLDVPARGKANGKTVVLLHGKNFCAGTWEVTIDVLTTAGYRVIAPDQVGFCKSTKPQKYQILVSATDQ
ncbi:hypothetical protein [Mesorhizobium sp. ISC15]|uniref:hypothetical protein n=1 Tax=Mesorhizobium sp. ISC15 TaxID=3076429 RepID=UPI00301B8855